MRAIPCNLSTPKPYERTAPAKCDFYVCDGGAQLPDGVDFSDNVLCSIDETRDAIRYMREQTGSNSTVTVYVCQGEYRTNGLEFDERDSNTIWFADTRGEVVLNGGMTIPPRDFKPVPPNMRERLKGDAKDKVLCADLKKYGLTPDDWDIMYAIGAYNTERKYDGKKTGTSCELFWNNKRMTLARYPNDNKFLSIDRVLDCGDVAEFPEQNYFTDWESRRNHRGGAYIMDGETALRTTEWKSHDDIWIFGYFYHDWADSSTPIKRLRPEVRCIEPEYVSCYACRAGARYYFYNVFEELDEPGEWYLDRKNGILYVYPLSDIESATIDISLTSKNIISANGVENLTLDGFTLKGTRTNAIYINGNKNSVKNCKILNVAENAVIVNGNDNLVTRCDISHTGKGGINMTGGDRETLTPSNNVADNNYIHSWSEIYLTYQPGISLHGVGGTCSHNEFYDSPHMAIGYSGNNHLVEYNYVHEVVKQSNDAGALYAGQDWAGQGTVVRYNCFCNVGAEGFHPQSIYWDDGLSGQTAYGNIIVNAYEHAFLIGGGRDNNIYGNISIDAAACGISYDDRNRDGFVHNGWARKAVNTPDGMMWKNLRKVPFRSEIWQKAYPELAKITEDFNDYDNPDFPINPKNVSIHGNIIISPHNSIGNIAQSVYTYGKVYDNIVYPSEAAEEIFTDAANGDYRIKAGSDAEKRLPDFEPIPFEKIGRY